MLKIDKRSMIFGRVTTEIIRAKSLLEELTRKRRRLRLISPAVEHLPPMFLRLCFSQMVAEKLTDDHGIDLQWTLASLSDRDIVMIFEVIRKPNIFVGERMLEEGIKFLNWLERTSSLPCSCP